MEWRYSKKIKKRIEKGKLSKDELKAIEKAKEIIEACRDINEFRQHHKVRKMKGSKYEYYRIKVSHRWRVICLVVGNIVIIMEVGPRNDGEVYRNFSHRIGR